MTDTENFDTSWFDLSNYDNLKELNLKGWIDQIEIRYATGLIIDTIKSSSGKVQADDLIKEYQSNIKNTPISGFQATRETNDHCIDLGDWRNNGSNLPFNTYSVRGTPLISHVLLSQDKNLDLDCIYDESKGLIGYTADMIYKEQNITWPSDDTTHVTVDLSATNNQILGDFKHWLTEYRKATFRMPVKKNFNQKTFNRWVRYGVIPYLDLMAIAKIEGKSPTHTTLANLIFCNDHENIDRTNKFRKKTIKEAKILMSEKMVNGLMAELANDKSGHKKV
jgi:hypothetical protein